jgi:hypothetical protein
MSKIVNSIKYNFSDFTLGEYEKLLDLALKTYTFKGFKDFDIKERDILWRHDIDMSPALALKTAEIEASKNIRATYFILLHSDFYNLLDAYNFNIIKKIIQLGHYVELHFDPFFYDINSEKELDEVIIFEKIFWKKYLI